MSDRLEQLARLPSVAASSVGPEGEQIALYYDVSGRNELYLLDPETGELERVSDGNVPRNVSAGFEWHPDGDHLYLHVDDDGDEQHDVHRMNLSGEREPVIELPGQTYLLDAGEEALLIASPHEGQMNLYRYEPATEELTTLTDSDRAVFRATLSPDETRVAYADNQTDDFDNKDVYVVDADGSNARKLAIGETGAEATPADWGPDGRRLLVSDTTTDLTRTGVYDTETDRVTWLGDGESQETPSGFLPDDRVVVTRVDGANRVPVIYDLETDDEHVVGVPRGSAAVATDPLADGTLLTTYTTPTDHQTLATYDPETETLETLLGPEYGDLDPERFVDAERFTVTSNGVAATPAAAVELEPAEEVEIEAILYEADADQSPLIVNPHGGPPAANTFAFGPFTQYLLGEGYSVLQVNYRGSTGRGQEFRELLHDDWGGAEQADIASAVEHVRDTREWVDDIAVFGGSYGGYSALWQLVQYPSLYDAGVAAVAVSDLVDMYENTMPHFKTELMEKYLGTPDENPDLYDERSPVTYADNLDAPLLLLHGVNDPRVPVSQARIFRDALVDAGYEQGEGGDFEYVEFGEEGHGSNDIERKLTRYRTLDDFLSRRMARQPATADD